MKDHSQEVNKKKILLAEDDEQIARIVEFKLNREGYEVEIARNGKEAVDSFSKQPWSLIILDVMMPIKTGLEVLQELRASSFGEIPVLILSAKGYQKDITHAAELGATDYLKKPFFPNELADLVKKMCSS